MNIHIKIPQMTLDQIFYPLPASKTIFDYTVTQKENRDALLGDADMAKEVTEYTKQNILLQVAQSMLAQANQLHSSILSLLG